VGSAQQHPSRLICLPLPFKAQPGSDQQRPSADLVLARAFGLHPKLFGNVPSVLAKI